MFYTHWSETTLSCTLWPKCVQTDVGLKIDALGIRASTYQTSIGHVWSENQPVLLSCREKLRTPFRTLAHTTVHTHVRIHRRASICATTCPVPGMLLSRIAYDYTLRVSTLICVLMYWESVTWKCIHRGNESHCSKRLPAPPKLKAYIGAGLQRPHAHWRRWPPTRTPLALLTFPLLHLTG